MFNLKAIWQLEVIILVFAACALIGVGGHSLAQIQRAEQAQDDRNQSRIQRQVDGLQKSHDELRLDIEKRLTKIETYAGAGLWLLGAIGAVLLGQLGKGLLDLMAARRRGH